MLHAQQLMPSSVVPQQQQIQQPLPAASGGGSSTTFFELTAFIREARDDAKVRKRPSLQYHFIVLLKMVILPRQARDKHRKNLRKERRFLTGREGGAQGRAQDRNGSARKRHFLRHLYIKIIILPRQARDKQRENSKKVPFSLRQRKEMQTQLDEAMAKPQEMITPEQLVALQARLDVLHGAQVGNNTTPRHATERTRYPFWLLRKRHRQQRRPRTISRLQKVGH